MPRSLTLIAAGVVAVLTLSACGPDDPQPNYSSVSAPPSSSTPTPSTSDSPTGIPSTGPNVSPGEVAPTEPDAATADTTTGALSFAAFYIRAVDWTFATADSTILTPFYAASCTTCQSRLDYLKSLFSNGTTLRGGRVKVIKSEIVSNDGRLGASMAVSTAVSVAPASVVASNGSVTSSLSPESFISLTTWLTWDGSGWQIVEERYA